MDDLILSAPDNAAEEAEVVAFLMARAAAPREVIETHAARVILSGDRALKLKKRVKLPFLDFTAVAARRAALERELELNKPHAADLYRRVIAVTREADRGLALGGAGHAIDWVLDMRRFDEANVLTSVAARGAIDATLADGLARMVAHYHASAPPRYGVERGEFIAYALEPLLAGLFARSSGLDQDKLAQVASLCRAAHDRVGPLVRARALQGAVRRCHGDLHLGNIVLIDGVPVPFDALEFDEGLATIDVFYDLAFLLMDLVRRGLVDAANHVFNSYMKLAPIGNEVDGLPLLPLFLAMRALVRAIVALANADQARGDLVGYSSFEAKARGLVLLAERCLSPPPPRLVGIGGFSGSGKSTVAMALAPEVGALPGALHLRSDVERKHLFGVDEHQPLGKEHYTQAVSDEIYRLMFAKARLALAAGHSVIVDAVFAKPDEREALEAVARDVGCGFSGLWLDAPADTLIERVKGRVGDASDADESVVASQLAYRTGTIRWLRVSSRGTLDETVAAARTRLGS